MKTITEENKLIAEFMGGKMKVENYHGINIIEIDSKTFDLHGLKYHLSWDWLIPVVDKCYQEHMSKHIAEAVMTFDIDKVYQVVVEFIKEYNA